MQNNLPDGWKWVTLSEICEINPRRPSLTHSDDSLTTFVPMASVDEQSGTILSREIKQYGEVKKGYTYFQENDVLFAKITPCMQNGKHAIAKDLLNGFAFGTTEFHVLRPSDKILSTWIHRYLRQPEILKMAESAFTGSVGQQRVPKEFLIDLPIPLPPLDEQKRIAAIIDEQMQAIEDARAAAQAELEAAENLAAAYLREVFESDEAQEWETKELGEVCEIQLGKMLSSKARQGTNPQPYLRNANVQWNSFELEDILEMDFDEREQSKFALKPGDLLVCEGGEPGRAAVWSGQIAPCYYQKALHRLRPIDEQVYPYFVLYRLWLGGIAGEFTDSHAKTTIAHLPAIRLKALPISFPNKSEQINIVNTLSTNINQIEEIITVIRERIRTIDSLPAAILRRAFNGEY